jgi:succinoglycan biosynthesis transport protein ExoP
MPVPELSPHFIRPTGPHIGGSSFPSPAALDGLPIRDYLRLLRRHLTLILAVTVSTLLVAGIVIAVIAPTYTATSTIMIEPQPPQVLAVKELLVEPDNSDAHDYYKTQNALLESRSLAQRVIRSLALQHNVIFSPPAQGSGLISGLCSGIGRWITSLTGSSGPAPRMLTEEDEVPAPLIDHYLGSLLIQPEFGTRLVKVSFKSPDPYLSAMIANAHAHEYLQQGMDIRMQAGEAAEQFLQAKLVELKERVETSEAALNKYRHDKGIVTFTTGNKNEILLKRLEQLNIALTQAETGRIALESEVNQIQRGDYDSLPGVVNSAVVQALKPQLATQEAQYAAIAARYTEAYGPLQALKAEVTDTRRRLNEAVADVAQSVRRQYVAESVNEQSLQKAVDHEKARDLALNDASLQDGILARDVDTNRELYENVLRRMKEIGVAAETTASNVSIVDSAEPPLRPSSPNKSLDLMLAALLGLLGGISVAFAIESLDESFKNAEDLEQYLRLPHLASIPIVGRPYNAGSWLANGAGRLMLPGGELPANGNGNGKASSTTFATQTAVESYRGLRTRILFSRAGQSPHSLLITSALPGEGKSVTAVNTAITFARKGRHVLLIDGDLRRSRCHTMLGLAAQTGLSEVLTDQADVHDVIMPTAFEGMFFLSAGTEPPDPVELLGSMTMRRLLTDLGTAYDFIVIDSAPVMLVSDPLVMAALVDGVVVVAGQPTDKRIVKKTCDRLSSMDAKVLGIVLNRATAMSQGPGYYYNNKNYYNGYKREVNYLPEGYRLLL